MKPLDVAVGIAVTVAGGIGLALLTRDSSARGKDYRKCVVATARAQLGKRELERYFATAAPVFIGQKPEWCGIFALWVLKECGLGAGVEWIVAKGFLFRLKRTTTPQPGDIAYFTKFNHQAIVERVRGDEVDLLNGNGQGGVVSASTKRLSDAAAYYSIQPWIDAVKGGAD